MALIFVLGAFATLLAAVQSDAGFGNGDGYSYNRPSSSFGAGNFGGYRSVNRGYLSGVEGYSSGGSFVPVPPGPSTYEGQYVDPRLLEQVRQVILKDETNSAFSSGYQPSSSYGAPSNSYIPPSTSYGVPSLGSGAGYQSRVVGIELEDIKPSIQIAEYESTGGYSGAGISSSYGTPFSSVSSFGNGFSNLRGSYGAPTRSSSSFRSLY